MIRSSLFGMCAFALAMGCTEVGDENQGLDEVEIRAVLDVANDLDAIELEVDVGLDAASAEEIVRYKLGPDGEGATLDDRAFDTLESLVAIEGVSPVTVELLLEFAGAHGFLDDMDDLETIETSSDCWTWRDGEPLFMQLVNRARSSRGIRVISRDMHLGRVARRWAGIIASRNSLAHNPNVAGQVTRWSWLGENVGVRTNVDTLDQRVRALHSAFMNSAPHRANILSRSARFQGIGVAYGHGSMWVAEVFEGTNNPGTTLSMPQCP